MHTLTWDCAGKYDPAADRIIPFAQSYPAWVLTGLQDKIARACRYNQHTTPADLSWIAHLTSQPGPADKTPAAFCPVLGDYGEHNVVVAPAAPASGQGWRVSGVFDLMTAHFGNGYADLCAPVAGYIKVDAALADAFVQEYLRRRPARPDFTRLQQLYTLGLYASMWEYWQRENGGPPENPGTSFEQWAGPAVAYWERFEEL